MEVTVPIAPLTKPRFVLMLQCSMTRTPTASESLASNPAVLLQDSGGGEGGNLLSLLLGDARILSFRLNCIHACVNTRCMELVVITVYHCRDASSLQACFLRV